MTDDQGREQRQTESELEVPPDFGEAMVTPSQDTVFHLLSNESRRAACLHLSAADANVHKLSELATAVASVVDRDSERVAVGLHHQHLPKLDRAGLVDYDPRSRTIRYRGQPCIEKWAAEAQLLADRESESAD